MRDESHTYNTSHLGDSDAVVVIDESGFLKKGRYSIRVACQATGIAGRVENYQKSGSTTGRCRQAGIPDNRCFATKLALAQQMLQRALAVGVSAKWVTDDGMNGNDRRLRRGNSLLFPPQPDHV